MAMQNLQPLTSKPVLYLANVGEGEPLEPPAALRERAAAVGARATAVSARLEAELSELDAGGGGGACARSSAWRSRASPR